MKSWLLWQEYETVNIIRKIWKAIYCYAWCDAYCPLGGRMTYHTRYCGKSNGSLDRPYRLDHTSGLDCNWKCYSHRQLTSLTVPME